MSSPSEITRLLHDAKHGNEEALNRLYPLVYDQLREIARRQLNRRRGDSFETTALVHEAYLKMFDQSSAELADRAHFFALSARAMRQILVDHFRKSRAGKRGGQYDFLTLQDGQIPAEERGDILLALDAAMQKLGTQSKRLCQVVEYKFFGGMSQEEIATVMGVTDRTVRSDWRKARAWLANELKDIS